MDNWLPSYDELGPVPLPPNCNDDSIITPINNISFIDNCKQDIIVYSHNILLIENIFKNINNTNNDFILQIPEYMYKLKDMKIHISKLLKQLKENIKNDNNNVKLYKKLKKLLKRIIDCLDYCSTYIKRNSYHLINNNKEWIRYTNVHNHSNNNCLLGIKRKNNTDISSQVIIERDEVIGECSICWERFDNDNYEFILECGHNFCFQCLKSLCVLRIYDLSLILDFGCPWKDCEYIINENELKRLVNEDELLDYYKNKNIVEKQNNPNIRYCPIPSCSTLIDNGSYTNKHIICPSCNNEYCFICMNIWHGEDISCDEYIKQNKDDPTLILFHEWADKHNVKPCPKCNIMIELTSGCNHIKCFVCKYEFCWLCLEYCTDDHFTKGDCIGKQFYNTEFPSTYSFHLPELDIPFNIPPVYNTEPLRDSILLNLRTNDLSLQNNKEKPKRRLLALPQLFPFRKRKETNAMDKISICCLGESGVGKSCCLAQFLYNHFFDTYIPTVQDIYRKITQFHGRPFILEMLDTSGVEHNESLYTKPIKERDAFILVFSCTKQSSIDRVDYLIDNISKLLNKPTKDIPIVIVGNFCDKDTEYDFEMSKIRKIADKALAPLIFTSARFNTNISEAFNLIISETIKLRI